MLKPPAVIVDLSATLFCHINIFFMYFDTLFFFDDSTFQIIVSSWWTDSFIIVITFSFVVTIFVLKSALSDINIAIF